MCNKNDIIIETLLVILLQSVKSIFSVHRLLNFSYFLPILNNVFEIKEVVMYLCVSCNKIFNM